MIERPEQGALFDMPIKPRRQTWVERLENITPLYARGESRPWDVIDAADQELGWEHRYIDHRRAVQIRHEVTGRA